MTYESKAKEWLEKNLPDTPINDEAVLDFARTLDEQGLSYPWEGPKKNYEANPKPAEQECKCDITKGRVCAFHKQFACDPYVPGTEGFCLECDLPESAHATPKLQEQGERVEELRWSGDAGIPNDGSTLDAIAQIYRKLNELIRAWNNRHES